MVKYGLSSGTCLQRRNLQNRSLGRYHATWVKPLARFPCVQKLVNRRAGYKESRKVLQGRGGTIVMNVGRALLRAQVSFDIKEFTLENDPTSVMSVGKPSVGVQVFLITEESTT